MMWCQVIQHQSPMTTMPVTTLVCGTKTAAWCLQVQHLVINQKLLLMLVLQATVKTVFQGLGLNAVPQVDLVLSQVSSAQTSHLANYTAKLIVLRKTSPQPRQFARDRKPAHMWFLPSPMCTNRAEAFSPSTTPMMPARTITMTTTSLKICGRRPSVSNHRKIS